MNLLRSLRNWLTGRNRFVRRSKQPARTWTRLCLEQLEDRTMPSGIYQMAGAASVAEGSNYVLNLNTDEAVSQWRVDWGDGQVQTVAGNPASIDHTYADNDNFDISVIATDGTGDHAGEVAGFPGLLQLGLAVGNVAPTLTLTPLATTNAPPTLDLGLSAPDPGEDTITSWTVYWGDGQSDMLPGTASSASHVYTQPGTFNVAAAATDEDGTYATWDLIVGGSDATFRYSGASGAFQGVLPSPFGILGPDGNYYVHDTTSGQVLRFADQTGAPLGVFATIHAPGQYDFNRLTFGPDGHLYVSAWNAHQVARFDGQTGDFLDVFLAPSSGLSSPYGMTFGPDGNLYVAEEYKDDVLRFDGQTGAFIDVFVLPGSGGLDGPNGLAFGPDGNLCVMGYNNSEVLHYDGQTGAFLDAWGQGLFASEPYAVGHPNFAPDGALLVPDRVGDRILRFDGATGALIDVIVPPGAGGLESPFDVTFPGANQLVVTVLGDSLVATLRAVVNSRPIAEAGADLHTLEGGFVTLAGTFTDGNDANPATHAFVWEVRDAVGQVVATDTHQNFDFVPADNGVYTATFTVTDSDGLSHSDATTVTVFNVAPKVIISGSVQVVIGTPYTVFLSADGDPGADTIQQWTIAWGDGTVETLVGNATSATHTYTQAQLFYDVFATATDEDGTYVAYSPNPNLLINNHRGEQLTRFDPETGFSRGTFPIGGPIVSTGHDGVYGHLTIGPDGNLYVGNETGVERFDGRTGEYLGRFNGDYRFQEIAFGPDGNFYGSVGNRVVQLDGQSGVLLADSFATAGSSAFSFAFGPDGNLYVSDIWQIKVYRFDAVTGASLGTFLDDPFGGRDRVGSIAIGPDGYLYVSGYYFSEVQRFDLATGSLVDLGPFIPGNYADAAVTTLQIVFSPDGTTLYMTARGFLPRRYDVQTGTRLADVPMGITGYFTFMPGLALHSPVTVLPIGSNAGFNNYIATVSGTLSPVLGTEFYSFPGAPIYGSFSSGQMWHFHVQALAGSNLDPKLELFDVTGLLIASSDDQVPGTTAADLIMHFGPATPGPYYIAVTASDPAAIGGSYQLTVDGNIEGNQPAPPGGADETNASSITGDFNRDGNLDLAINVNLGQPQSSVAVYLGQGDGTFQVPAYLALGQDTRFLITADFNDDGRPDLAAANTGSQNISVLLGYGDGRFQEQVTYALPFAPNSVVASDFDGDGKIDLIAGGASSNQLALLQGKGDGTFENAQLIPGIPGGITQLVGGDFDGDGYLDLAAGTSSQGVFLFYGDGTGSFTVQTSDQSNLRSTWGPLGQILGLRAGQFTDSGRSDLLISSNNNVGPDTIGDCALGVFLGNENRTFSLSQLGRTPNHIGYGVNFPPVTLGDFNGDGHLDVEGGSKLYIGNGTGGFNGVVDDRSNWDYWGVNAPKALIGGDFNGDGRDDVTFFNQVFLSIGYSRFLAAPNVPSNSVNPPIVQDVDGDGHPDILTVDSAGNILFRAGTETPGVHASPVLVNPNHPANDATLVEANGKWMILAADRQPDAQDRYGVSVYEFVNGGWQRQPTTLATDPLPSSVVAGDLDGDDETDLVVRNLGSGTLSLFRGDGTGGFQPAGTVAVPQEFGGVVLTDVSGDLRPDMLLANFTSGEITVLVNQGMFTFATTAQYYSGNGRHIAENSITHPVTSDDGFIDQVSGDLNGDGRPDLVTLNAAHNSFAVLYGKPLGNFTNPQSYAPTSQPTAVTLADFNNDGKLDIVIGLDNSKIAVYLNGPTGLPDDPTFTIDVAGTPNGLTPTDVNGDGKLDLLVSNAQGDVLILIGKGNGTFEPFRQAGSNVPFVAKDLNGDNVPDVMLANQSLDQALAQIRQAGTTSFSLGNFSQTGNNGLIGPGFVTIGDLNRDGLDDFIVANSGSNNVLVYLGTAPGQFATTPMTFVTGTNPSYIAVRDVNGDGTPDLAVANQGSNDVTLLLGEGAGIGWTMTQGTRLDSGGIGPNSIDVRDQNNDGILDLIVTNGQSGTATLLPGIGTGSVGTGFFNDTNPATTIIGGPVKQTANDGRGNLLFLRTSGSIFSFNPATFSTAARLVFTSSPDRFVTALTTVSNSTSLVVGRSDSSLSILNEQDNGQYAEALIFRDARLDTPSALEVIGGEVYVTNEGSSVPLVIGMASFITANPSFFITLLEGGASRGQFAQLNLLEGSNLAFVATLLTGGENENGEGFIETESESNFVATGDDRNQLPGRLNLLALFSGIESGVQESGGDEEEEEVEGEAWKAFVIGIDEALQEHMNQDVDERLNLGPDMPSADMFEIAMEQWLQEHRGPSAVTADVAAELPASGLLVEEDYRWIDPRHDAVALSLARALVESKASGALVVLPGMLGSVEESSSVLPPCVERPRRDLDWTSVFAAGLVGCSAGRVKRRDREEENKDVNE